ncbi:MAG: hypothetical protein WCC52_01035 [Nitrosotalea sp.]
MKILHISIIAILIFITLTGFNAVMALIVPSPFVLNTDKTQYNESETIKISGTVANSIVNPNQTVTIDVFGSDGKLYKNSTVNLAPQKNPFSNGFYTYGYAYEYDVKTGNNTLPGPYQIVAHYGNAWQDSNTITYNPTSVDYDKYYTYNAFFGKIPYPIRYKITQGNELAGLGMDTENKILYISVTGVENKSGYLTLELPRNVIDSRYDNGTNKNYTVNMGATGAMIGETNDFREIQTNEQNRTLEFGILPYNASYTIMLYGTSMNTTGIIMHHDILPLKQFKSGTPVNNVKCNDGLQLVIKDEDGSPACVKSDTVNILITRGWGHLP